MWACPGKNSSRQSWVQGRAYCRMVGLVLVVKQVDTSDTWRVGSSEWQPSIKHRDTGKARWLRTSLSTLELPAFFSFYFKLSALVLENRVSLTLVCVSLIALTNLFRTQITSLVSATVDTDSGVKPWAVNHPYSTSKVAMHKCSGTRANTVPLQRPWPTRSAAPVTSVARKNSVMLKVPNFHRGVRVCAQCWPAFWCCEIFTHGKASLLCCPHLLRDITVSQLIPLRHFHPLDFPLAPSLWWISTDSPGAILFKGGDSFDVEDTSQYQ